MDPLTIISVVGAFIFLFVGVILEGTNPGQLIGIPAFLIVVLPTIMVGLSGFVKKDVSTIVAATKRGLFGKVEEADDSVRNLVSFAERARREGLLALEEEAKGIEDPFLKKGVQLAVDGTDPEELAEILTLEIQSKKAHDQIGIKFYNDIGGYSPTLGIIGAVVGLIAVLQKLDDPLAAGHGIAVAFIATFYGVAFANMIFLPLGNKLKRLSEIEVHHMELMLEGILAIQAGANPRVIEQKLFAFLHQTGDAEEERAA
ncbi:MAG TPA: flagellar motor protein [Acidimicrobiia bacterium]|nr:flagellar motor protein [Acidimicrobiia bacterium]